MVSCDTLHVGLCLLMYLDLNQNGMDISCGFFTKVTSIFRPFVLIVREWHTILTTFYYRFRDFCQVKCCRRFRDCFLVSPCPPSLLGTWFCEGGGHGSEATVSGKLV